MFDLSQDILDDIAIAFNPAEQKIVKREGEKIISRILRDIAYVEMNKMTEENKAMLAYLISVLLEEKLSENFFTKLEEILKSD